MPDSRVPIIGIDASRAATLRKTGTERYSQRIVQELLDLTTEERVRLYVNGRTPIPLRQRAGVQQRLIPMARLWTHLRLSWELTRHPVDALFIPSHVVPLRHPAATVVTIHDLGYLHEPEAHTNWSRRYLEWSTRWSVRAARRIIAISEATSRDLTRHYDVPREKITVVYHGVDERFRPNGITEMTALRQSIGVSGTFVLYVGTIQPRKNLVRLIEAFDLMASETPELSLVLAGKLGWKTQEILDAARRSPYSSRIHLPGHVTDDQLPALYAAASVFVLPSLYEGFGMPVIEAMSCGTPCVISDRGSLPEVAGDAAMVVDPLDVSAIANGIKHALACEDRQNWIDRGFERARSFSWVRAGHETREVIRCAMANRG